MGWTACLFDSMTGLLAEQVDLPSFSWTLSVGDCSLSTTRDKGTGEGDASGLRLPWAAVPGRTAAERHEAIAMWRRGIVLMWDGAPVVAGIIGPKSGTERDVSIDLISPLEVLAHRYAVREGVVGKGEFRADHTKRADGTSYGGDLGGFRPYMRWERTETPDNVSLWCEMGIEVTADKVDADDVWIEATVGDSTKEWQLKGGLHKEGAASRVICRTDSASKARTATQSSLKASVKVSVPSGEVWKSNSGGHKKGDPKYKSSSAAATATVKTAADYEASYKKLSNTSHASVTADTITLTGSLRSIVCRLGRLACSKPGGALPIDWPYVGEAGGHERTYEGFNVSNNDIKKLITDVCNVDGGPDVQLRPYLADPRHLRWRLEAGSDSEPYLGDAPVVPVLTCFPGGGTAQNLSWAELAPAMRVYATGAGQGEATLCHLSEDLSLCQRRDPWPLVESRVSGSSDWDTADLVRAHADAALAASRLPMVQWQCEVDAVAGPVTPGALWPGQRVLLDLDGSPIWPDGRYALRVMEMSGDEGSKVKLTFDQTVDPWEGVA